ncbi:MAG: hypothetical protein IPI67_15735 [Myxococcales bacterium]|nr:hypothetical protein [Myxococcales bacterium]
MGGEYPGPDIVGCEWNYANNFCCPAGCTRYAGYDGACGQYGLGAVGRACTLGAPLPAGCQPPHYATSSYVPVCCPS